MKNLPKRPREHVLEDLSIDFVKQVLPSEWIIEDGRKDYGIDLFVEIVEKEQVTGAHFLMQVKATDYLKTLKNGDISFTFDKTSTLEYFLERPELILFLLYDAVSQTGYWVWIQEYLRSDVQKEWRNQGSYTIRISKDNQFNPFQVERIRRRVLENHRKEKILNFIATENNPHIGYKAEFGKGFQKITGFYKYPGAEKDAPVEIGMNFKFDKTDEGVKALENLNNAFAKGETARIDARFVDQIRFSKLFSPELFGDDDFELEELVIAPLKKRQKVCCKGLNS